MRMRVRVRPAGWGRYPCRVLHVDFVFKLSTPGICKAFGTASEKKVTEIFEEVY